MKIQFTERVIHKTKAKERSHLFHGVNSHRGIAPAVPRKNKSIVALVQDFYCMIRIKSNLPVQSKLHLTANQRYMNTLLVKFVRILFM